MQIDYEKLRVAIQKLGFFKTIKLGKTSRLCLCLFCPGSTCKAIYLHPHGMWRDITDSKSVKTVTPRDFFERHLPELGGDPLETLLAIEAFTEILEDAERGKYQ